MNVLELDNVSKIFGQGRLEVRPVDDVSLAVPEGQMLVIMGPSGSGKTTLLQMMGALLSPTAGRIRIRGQALDGMGSCHLARVRLTEIGRADCKP